MLAEFVDFAVETANMVLNGQISEHFLINLIIVMHTYKQLTEINKQLIK